MKKLLAIFMALISIFYLLPSNVFAQYGQYSSPNPSFSISINKMVGMPDNSVTDASKANFVDNLSPSDPRFQPGQTVFFKLDVKNTSNVNLTSVAVQDFVPDFLNPISGPGEFDPATRIITIGAGDFNPGDDKVYFLQMQVLAQNQLPADKGLFCVVNRAKASANQTSDEDTSQLCIEKQVLGATTVPSTGPEFGLALLAADFIGLGAGLWLRKKI